MDTINALILTLRLHPIAAAFASGFVRHQSSNFRYGSNIFLSDSFPAVSSPFWSLGACSEALHLSIMNTLNVRSAPLLQRVICVDTWKGYRTDYKRFSNSRLACTSPESRYGRTKAYEPQKVPSSRHWSGNMRCFLSACTIRVPCTNIVERFQERGVKLRTLCMHVIFFLRHLPTLSLPSPPASLFMLKVPTLTTIKGGRVVAGKMMHLHPLPLFT